ncbi:hypothetical protein [Micropruina sp.]|uniref:hypothetical protein n=1 Tax=Micropruina sp. TaxID=2737536 RepID=UPI0039E2D5C7
MTNHTAHVHDFRAGEVWCTGCLAHRPDCDCWRCDRTITLVMPDGLSSNQYGEINARTTAAFDALVNEVVRLNAAESVTR